jgi:hypothetical protein
LAVDKSAWVVEELSDGILLLGSPNPYRMQDEVKKAATKYLQLDKRLDGVVERKNLTYIPQKKIAPPKGVIE